MSKPRRPGARFGGKRKATAEPSPTGAIIGGTDPCTCGHAPEEHGREPVFPGSTECRECEDGDGGPGCIAYEADPEATRPRP